MTKPTSRLTRLFLSGLLLASSVESIYAVAPEDQAKDTIVLDVVTITAKPYVSSALTSPQPVTVVEGRRLQETPAQNAADLIADTPGVASYTTGTGLSKPVIRGLTSQRVLLVSDGLRQEFQQWGEEHAPQIDPLNVERVEVLRGPNSLLYGSDALGGVVAFSSPALPHSEDGARTLSAKATAGYFSNNKQVESGLALFGAKGPFGYRFSVSGRDGDNFHTPDNEVSNSAAKDFNGHGTFGLRQDWGTLKVNYGHVKQKVELPEEDPEETPRQELTDDQVSLHANVPVGAARFEATGAFQKNRREEFESKEASEAALNLLTKTSSFDLKAHHAPVGPFQGTVGLSFTDQNFDTLGEETLIPSYDSKGFGAYLYEEVAVKQVTFSAGLRGDSQKLDIQNNDALDVDAQTRKYNQMTGALGAVWRAAKPLAFAVNVGRGWRSPVAFELFSNGVHEGSGRFETGNADLKPERSLNIDIATRYASERVQAEVAVFRNKISRFIYAAPTGTDFTDPDTGDVAPIFEYDQSDATLVGGELSIDVMATPWLALTAGYDVVRGENDETNEDLPLIPADRFRGGVRFQSERWMNVFDRPYVSLEAKVFRRQDRIDPDETETPGYTLWNVSTGTDIKVGPNHSLSVNAGVENITDKKYSDHLSRNKTAGIFNPGRNFFVKLSMPFGVVR